MNRALPGQLFLYWLNILDNLSPRRYDIGNLLGVGYADKSKKQIED